MKHRRSTGLDEQAPGAAGDGDSSMEAVGARAIYRLDEEPPGEANGPWMDKAGGKPLSQAAYPRSVRLNNKKLSLVICSKELWLMDLTSPQTRGFKHRRWGH